MAQPTSLGAERHSWDAQAVFLTQPQFWEERPETLCPFPAITECVGRGLNGDCESQDLGSEVLVFLRWKDSLSFPPGDHEKGPTLLPALLLLEELQRKPRPWQRLRGGPKPVAYSPQPHYPSVPGSLLSFLLETPPSVTATVVSAQTFLWKALAGQLTLPWTSYYSYTEGDGHATICGKRRPTPVSGWLSPKTSRWLHFEYIYSIIFTTFCNSSGSRLFCVSLVNVSSEFKTSRKHNNITRGTHEWELPELLWGVVGTVG